MDSITNEKPKTTIWEKIAEEDLYFMMQEMDYSPKQINNQQKARVVLTLLVFILFAAIASFSSAFFYIFGVLFTIYFWRSRYEIVLKKYQKWRFMRHLGFVQFARKIVSYLLQDDGKVSLYTVLQELVKRTEREEDKKLIYQLMSEMRHSPNSIDPFITFAHNSSGTDMAELFMTTIYDFHQSTYEIEVIHELSKTSSEELMRAIDEIIEQKERRFNSFPRKVVMSTFIVFIGYAIAYMYSMIDIFQF